MHFYVKAASKYAQSQATTNINEGDDRMSAVELSTVQNVVPGNIHQALTLLEKGIDNISNNQEWQRFLTFQSKFYNYSFQNTLLIYSQKPNATYVAGFNSWKKLGRYVKKGEKSIKIFAPLRYKVERDSLDNDRLQQETYILSGFRLVNVFDLSQTAGDDSSLPVLIIGLSEHFPSDLELYHQLQTKLDITVTERADIAANGQYHLLTGEVAIKSSLHPVQKIKTLIHEYAHHIHRSHFFNDEKKSERELIAESVSFVACQHLNIDSSDYSFPYLRTWLDEPKQLKQLGDKISKIAAMVIEKLK